MLNKRSQQDDESFDAYIADLRRLIKTREYGDLKDSILKDRIVIGIKDDAIRKRLLQTYVR